MISKKKHYCELSNKRPGFIDRKDDKIRDLTFVIKGLENKGVK